jgi:UDP-N-acetylglucosamine diphosphorylase / glucose-1-phosphate thymidylyltransferase / UDP-N-acetylgalactosamine diphosphorylase / glucosamine-1-phosphate N-acetyltransferase / galactosamine-1-phosphate N-acetyltransferase
MIKSKKINILIPLGGAGKRFSDAGYKDPKPFIDVNGASMIKAVIKNLQHPSANFIFVINEEYVSISDFEEHIAEINIPKRVFSVNKLTEGPASTVLVAKKAIDNSDPLIVINCDQIIIDFDLDNIISFVETTGCDGLLGCFLSSSKKNSYVRLDPNGEVCEVKEKIVISNIATNGLHLWKSGSDFVESAEEMIACNDRYNNEFYVAPTYNYMIKGGKKILPFFYNLHFPIGTPEDLEYYLKTVKWKFLK